MKKGPNRKRKVPSGYFTDLRLKYGVHDPISKLPKGQLQKDSIRIFRDLQRGNLKWETEAYYFLDMRVLTALETEAIAQKNVASSIVRTASWYMTTNPYASGDQHVPNLLSTYKMKYEAFSILEYYFYMIRMTGDLNYLGVLLQQLKSYRGIF